MEQSKWRYDRKQKYSGKNRKGADSKWFNGNCYNCDKHDHRAKDYHLCKTSDSFKKEAF